MSTTNESARTKQHVHPEHSSELLQQLHLLLEVGENGGLCDVVLIAGKNGQRVPAHRVVLAASSPYFRTMFTGGMLESSASEVMLGDEVHGEYLQPLVKFCYTGKIEICVDTVDELVQTASRLQLDAVVSACSAFMEHNLDASNCLGVAALADLLSLGDLKKSADKYAQKHFVQVSQQEEFLKLNIAQLKVLIASDFLNVSSEESVYHSVISWLNYDTEKIRTRSEHAPALLALVRFSHLRVTLLMEPHVWDLCQEHACLPLLREAFKESIAPTRSRRIKPRKSMQSGFLAVYFGGKQEALSFAEYSSKQDEWNLFDTTFSARTKFGAMLFNNELLVVGGRWGCNYTNTVQSINLDTMALSELPSMSLERCSFGIAVLDGLLYVAGGVAVHRYGPGAVYRTFIAVNSVERYDPKEFKWSDIAPMPDVRACLGLAVLNGRLFAVGGEDDSIVLKSTECYDPQTNKWTQLASLNIPRTELSIASGNGFLYAVGGEYEEKRLHSIERYDPQTDKWTEIFSFNSLQDYVASVFLDDRLFILSSESKSPSLQEYNFITETWTERATLKQPVSWLRTALK